MKTYRSLNHVKYRLRYHLVFSTKYRRKALSLIEEDVKACMGRIADASDFDIIACGIDKDHCHLVVSAPPRLSLDKIVRRLKQWSTRQLWESHSGHLASFYWGDKRGSVLWTHGYFCETVGPVSEDAILAYVRNQ